MEENVDIKKELFSIYKIIENEVINNKIQIKEIKINEDINSINYSLLLNYIKELILLLINQNNNNIEFKNHYNQLEKYIIKLEMDNKYYLKSYMRNKIIKDSLENKLEAYFGLEEEYEELKEKVKYEGGKFLENDRKDNEIIILRRENSTLKKEIVKLGNKNKKIENKNNEQEKKILGLDNTIENLNKKISRLEQEIKEKENEIKNNLLHKNLSKSNSCSNLGSMNNENNLVKIDNNMNNENYSVKNFNNIFNFNNNNNKKILNFNSPKFDIYSNEQNQKAINKTINIKNTNNLISTYINIVKGFNNKKIKIPVKNEFTVLKESRNNSISIIHKGKDANKSILFNKINKDRYPNLSKSRNKTRNVKQFLKSKSPYIHPLTVKNNGTIIQKYIQREFNKNIINNSSYKI